MRVQIGDVVNRIPYIRMEGTDTRGLKSGVVVYVHPKGRYHCVRFDYKFSSFRECYMGVEK